jgi:hypothetical protein
MQECGLPISKETLACRETCTLERVAPSQTECYF